MKLGGAMKLQRPHQVDYKHHTLLKGLTQRSQVAFDVVERATLDFNARSNPARLVVESVIVQEVMLHKCATNQEDLVEVVRKGAGAIVEEETIVGKDLKIEVAKIVEEGHQADITLKAGKGIRVETDIDLIVEEIDLIVKEIEAKKGLALWYLMIPQRWQIELITH